MIGSIVTVDLIDSLLAASSSYTVLESAVQDLDSAPITDEDVATLRDLPPELRVHCLARLHVMADLLREHVRTLDGLLLGVPAES